MADFDQPNGLDFSPDGRILYVSDTSRALDEVPGLKAGNRHGIEAFDLDPDGTLGRRRFFCHTDNGVPDGLVVDARGWVWTSAGDGVHIWSADRRKLGFIPVPTVVCNVTLGGVDGKRLFIAASASLFAIDLLA